MLRLFILLTFATLNTFQIDKCKKNKIAIKVQLGTWKKGEKYNLLPAIISLINNTDDTIEYQSMSCSWYDFYETNINVLTIQGWSCDKNIQIIEKIPPHSIQERKLNFQTDGFIDSMYGVKFRLGFYLIQEHDSFNKVDFITHPHYYSQYLVYSDDIEITYKSHSEK